MIKKIKIRKRSKGEPAKAEPFWEQIMTCERCKELEKVIELLKFELKITKEK